MANTSIKIKKEIFNEIYLSELQNYDTRLNIFYGGAGSGKSHFVFQKIIYKMLKYPNRKTLVCRQVSNTLKDSCFAMIKSILSDWKILDQCKVNKTELNIELPNGSYFIMKGLDDPEKIKSITGIDDIVVEEISEVDEFTFDQLNLRLRSNNPFNQIHVMFNPVSKDSFLYKRYFSDEKCYDEETTMIMHTNYTHNKFLPDDYIKSLIDMKIQNPIYFRIYALGEFCSLNKLIYTKWDVLEFNYREILKEYPNSKVMFGLDFGYVADPTAFIASIIDESSKQIWVFDEFYEKGLLNDEIADKITRLGYRKEEIIADCAEQKSIAEIKRLGIPRIKPCSKGKDSILNGIQLLQQFTIHIHTDCVETQNEISNYTWKKDKSTNEYINVPIDKFNHLMDSLRYSCQGKITKHKFKTYKNFL